MTWHEAPKGATVNTDPRPARDDPDRDIAEGYERAAGFVFKAVTSTAEPRSDWRTAVHDAARDLDEIVNSDLAHPDDKDRARLAMASLAHIWLTVEEAETLYLGDRATP